MISVEQLSLSISGTQILQDVSFTLEAGRTLGLVGESGSGKSMTAFSLMRLLPRGAELAGRLDFENRDLAKLTERQMCGLRGAEIGMIFQEPMTALNPVQTIGDQVAETLLVHGVTARSDALQVARARLDRVGLTADRFPLDRYPHELSGGQRQRVCIALAVALRPKLLIADEPTTALDVTTQAQILDLLQELVAEEDMACLFISHDLAVVGEMANDVAVMQRGRIVERGASQTLLTAPQHPYAKALLAASDHRPNRTPLVRDTALLKVENAVRDYALPRRKLFGRAPRFRAVNGVSFTLRKGESLGLVGESGSGKSTLSRAVLGLDPLQAGTITLDDDPISPNMGADLRRRMQVVFQDPYGSFNPRQRVGRLITEPFYLAGLPKDAEARVAEALESVGLTPKDAEKYPHEFSGGQRQRIAIARALITRPELIVLDEAVSALDVSVRAQVLDLLADLQQQLGLSYLFITHDLTVVRAITDRVMVMQSGKIVEMGETEALFSDPQHSYTRALLAAAPTLPTA